MYFILSLGLEGLLHSQFILPDNYFLLSKVNPLRGFASLTMYDI